MNEKIFVGTYMIGAIGCDTKESFEVGAPVLPCYLKEDAVVSTVWLSAHVEFHVAWKLEDGSCTHTDKVGVLLHEIVNDGLTDFFLFLVTFAVVSETVCCYTHNRFGKNALRDWPHGLPCKVLSL